MKAIYLKELRSYFHTPIGYVFVAMMLLVMGFYYTMYSMYYQAADYYYVLDSCTIIIMFCFPVLTMRIFAEERRQKTDQLLMTSPVGTGSVVVGKFLAAETVFLIGILISLLQPLTTIVFFNGSMTAGMTVGGYVAFFLLGSLFIAIGMFISALTENQLVAAILTIAVFMVLSLSNGLYVVFPTSRYFSLAFIFVLLLLGAGLVYYFVRDLGMAGLALLGASIVLMVVLFLWPQAFDSLVPTLFQNLSVFDRYGDIFSGLLEVKHLVFFASVTAFFLFMTNLVVEKARWA